MVLGLVSTSVFPTFAASPTTVLKPENGYGGASYNKIVGGTITSSSDLNSADIVAGVGGSALIDWHVLNIGNGQSLNFSGSQFFNVVSGTDSSKIAGTLNANGALWIFNQNGISFIDGAQINVGSLFAVAAKLANQQGIEDAINGASAIPTPEFGDTLGKIIVEKADFTLNPNGTVSLVGNGVDINSGASFKDLQVVAGSKVVVDEVADGKIVVDIAEFIDGDDISFGTLGGDEDIIANDIEVITKGAVVINDAVKAEGDIYIAGSKPTGGSEPVIGVKQMSVASGKLLQGKSVSAFSAGKISVDGDIAATAGDVYLEAASDIELNGMVTAGDVTLDSTTYSTPVAWGSTSDTDVTVKGSSVKVNSNARLVASGDINVIGTGDEGVLVDGGIVMAKDGVSIAAITGNGDVQFNNNAYVVSESNASGSTMTISSENGSVSVAGSETTIIGFKDGTISASDGVLISGGEVAAGNKLTFTSDVNVSGKGLVGVGNKSLGTGEIDASGKKITLSDEGYVGSTTIKAGTLDVKAGTVEANTVAATVVQDGGTVTVADAVTGEVTQNAGTLSADAVVGNIEQNGGEITVTDKVTGDVTQKGGTLTAANEIKGDVEQVNGDISTAKIDGALKQSADGTLTTKEVTGVAEVAGKVYGDGELKFGSTLEQNGGSIDAKGNLKVASTANIAGTVKAADAEIGGKLTQTAGELTATGKLTLKDGADVSGMVVANSVDATDKTVTANTGANIDVAGEIKAGTLDINAGTVDAATVVATVVQDGGTVTVNDTVTGDVTQNAGTLSANAVVGNIEQNGGEITVTDKVTGNVTQKGGALSAANEIKGDVEQVNGDISTAKIDGTLKQSADGTLTTKEVTGAATVEGKVNSDGELKFGSTLTQTAGT
ncbi:MAG: filamentous hemagglutinin N-terminal domain-containing protein, partial [Kiritimatiellae bacterium]|nr:filamentous hemagglutinin N-terminal domain-containing protein [Kiritimatiellia bacterium]